MEIALVGISHRTAPVELREKLACPASELANELERLKIHAALEEVAMVSTCNRVEAYFTAENTSEAGERVRDFFSVHKQIAREEIDTYFYAYTAADAVKHLFKVSSSLDSMVLGEPQILGQVKESYRIASANRFTGTLLNKLFHKAFQAAKRVRTQTKVGSYAVSVSSAAVELAAKIFGRLDDRAVMVVGAGNMGELTAQHLLSEGVTNWIIINRTYATAQSLAKRLGGDPSPIDQLGRELEKADIIIATTGAPKPIITRDMVAKALKARKNRPMFFIDIAVPRDVEPTVNRLENVYLYDIDDLQGMSEKNLRERELEASRAEAMLADEVAKFDGWRSTLEVVPTIVELRNRFEKVAKAELDKALQSLPQAGEKERKALELLAHNIVGKLLHEPTTMLKKCSENGEGEVARSCRALFCLEIPDEEDNDGDEKGGRHE